jgi:hypothetical protein
VSVLLRYRTKVIATSHAFLCISQRNSTDIYQSDKVLLIKVLEKNEIHLLCCQRFTVSFIVLEIIRDENAVYTYGLLGCDAVHSSRNLQAED